MKDLVSKCEQLILAYKSGKLGQTAMPEDSHPANFGSKELRLAYFTLPMALNYQRDSYKLWQAALRTFNDPETKIVFDYKQIPALDFDTLQSHLLKYKLALQPNKHPNTWQTIATTINNNWGGFEQLIDAIDSDFLKLRKIVRQDFKKGFPYLSGPKIFNYWSFILGKFGGAELKNCEFIEIAPDTHITKCSVILGVITKEESENMSRDQISDRWRKVLSGSAISPIDMHPPLWFWSRNGFQFKLDK